MYYSVNLIPPHLKPQTGVNIKYMLELGFLGVLLCMAILYGYQFLQISQAEAQLAATEQQLQSFAVTQQQIEINRKLQNQIAAKDQQLSQIAKERPLKWSDTLVELGQATPPNLWLMQVSSETNGLVKMRGGAADIDTVTKYMNTLTTNPKFSNVTFLGLVQNNLHDPQATNSNAIVHRTVVEISLVIFELSLVVKGNGQ
jgi:Tfp pilus assembly protein PilN